MLKARTSFPSVIYENNEHHDDYGSVNKVASIMTRYHTRTGEIVQAEIMKQSELAGFQTMDNSCQGIKESNQTSSPERTSSASCVPDVALSETDLSLAIIKRSKRKVRQISNDFSRTDDDMKKLEREVQILIMVRKNLDNMTRKFWD